MSNESPRKPKGSSQSSSRSPRPSRDASGSRGSVQRSGGRPAGNSANAGREDRSAGRGADARRGSRDASGTVGGRASGKRTERPERSGSARGEHPRGDSAAQRPQRGAPARSERSARTENPRTERPRAERGQYAEERGHGQRAERGQDSVRGKGRLQGERSGRGTAAGERGAGERNSGERGRSERSTGERGIPARATSVRGATGRGASASGGRGAPVPEAVPAAVKAKLSQAERFPKAEFARREGLLEGFPAVMVVNRSLKGYAYRKEFPWCLRLAIAYAADSATGQPLPKEERMLEAFEQNLFGLLKKSVNGHYVGHTTWGGSREFVFYLDDGGEAEEPLEGFAQAQKRELELSLDEDVRWEQAAHYFDYRD